MNQKSNIHGVIIGLLVLCLLLTGVGLYFLNKQLTELKGTMEPVASAPIAGKIALLNNCKTPSSAYIGVCFDYPKDWVIASFDDEFMDGQKNLLITSSPGRLLSAESSGGPGMPGVQYFQDGYQITMHEIKLGGPDEVLGPKLSDYTNLYGTKDVCNEVGCPNEQYYFYDRGYDRVFEIMINYTVAPSEARPFVDTILRSLELGP